MANKAPSFQNGSNLILNVNGADYAYATSLSFSEEIQHSAIGGLGSFVHDALEPTQYSVRGSFIITQYLKASTITPYLNDKRPARAKATGGNSITNSQQFNPASLVNIGTFDITVYEKGVDAGKAGKASPLFVVKDARLNGYNLNFVPGSLVTERVSFIAIEASDRFALASAIKEATLV